MSIETKDKQVGDCVYRVTQLGGKASRAVQLRLARAVAAALCSDKGIDLGAVWEDAKGFRFDLSAAFTAISAIDLEFVCDTFAEKTIVMLPDHGENAPKPIKLLTIYDGHFGGSRQLEQWQWLLFAFEVNFGGGFFFEALARAKAAKEVSKSASRPAPTGSSGVSAPPSV